MVVFDKEHLKEILRIEHDYPESFATKMILMLENLDDKLQSILDVWIADRILLDFSVKGVTIKAIMDKKRCDFYNALLYMNGFIQKPELAKQFANTPVFFFGKKRHQREENKDV